MSTSILDTASQQAVTHNPVSAPASTRVYDHLKSGILSGRVPTGSFVTEGELAETVGVSRTPAREALLRLEGEGLVRLYPKKGALVVPPTADDARDVLEARIVIEEWAAATVWPRRAELVQVLEPELAAMRATRKTGDLSALVEHDRHFHELIVDAAGNAILSRTYQGLRDRQLTIVAAQMRQSASRIDNAIAGHSRLVDLLRSGSKKEFVAASREHVENAMAFLQGRP